MLSCVLLPEELRKLSVEMLNEMHPPSKSTVLTIPLHLLSAVTENVAIDIKLTSLASLHCTTTVHAMVVPLLGCGDASLEYVCLVHYTVSFCIDSNYVYIHTVYSHIDVKI